jgi:hypothetical protein
MVLPYFVTLRITDHALRITLVEFELKSQKPKGYRGKLPSNGREKMADG